MRRVRRMIVLLVLLALSASVVWAANPLVDGNIATDPGWQSTDIVATDDDEDLISQQYDIEDVYVRSSDDDLTFFGGFEVYGGSIDLRENGSISFGLDTDPGNGTGGPLAGGVCPGLGVDYRLDYLNLGEDGYYNRVKRWTGSGWQTLSPPPLIAQGPDYEMAVEYARLGLTEPKCVNMGVYFENRASDPDDGVCFTWCPENGGGEGCTPGYWKQSQHFGSWVSPYSPIDPQTYFDAAFGVNCTGMACEDKTLLQALGTGGGGEKALMRHAVAALLNAAANSGVDYLYTPETVIQMVKDAYAAGGDIEGTKNFFADENELGCPLGRNLWSPSE